MHELIKLLAEVRPLRDPVLLASFAGRGGSSATAAVQYLVDHWHALPVAEIDEQESFDFTVRRPHVRIEQDLCRQPDHPRHSPQFGTRFHPAAGDGAAPALAVVLRRRD